MPFDFLNTLTHKTRFWLGLLLASACAIGFSAWVSQGFHAGCYYHPMFDAPLFCNAARLFVDHFSWFPWPQLALGHSNATLFPFGSIQFFMGAYMFEANLLAWFLRPWGEVWLPVYVGYSFTVLGVGSFLLLYKPYGVRLALLFTLVLLFLNPAFAFWFPARMGGVFVHWAALGLISDVLLLDDLRKNQRIAIGLLALRVMLLCLAMGLDTGYIAPFAMTSFGLFCVFYGHALYRAGLLRYSAWQPAAGRYLKAHRWRFGGMLAVSVLALWLYVPLLLQVLFYAFHSMFGEAQGLRFASPLRTLLPYFPFFHPGYFHSLLDLPEGLWANSVGWAVLTCAALALWQQRRHLTHASVFLLTLAGLLLTHFPGVFSLLQILPWHHFSRIADRFSVLIPVLFLLLALGVRWEKLPAWLPYTILLLAAVEAGTLYHETLLARTKPHQPQRVESIRTRYQQKIQNPPAQRVESIRTRYQQKTQNPPAFFQSQGATIPQAVVHTPQMQRYFAILQKTPGEALFNWPFCLHSGTVEGQEFCPFILVDAHRMSSYYDTLALKKTNQYTAGRLAITPAYQRFVRQGWEHALMPNAKTYRPHFRQQRCLNTAEKNLLKAMLQRYDFAGIQLHPGLLAQHCIKDFYAHFGQPVISAILLQGYPLAFIPNRWRGQNPTPPSAEPPRLTYAMDGKQANFLTHERPYAVSSTGLHYVYSPALLGKVRYSRGEKVTFRFFLNKPASVRIQMQGHSRRNQQGLALICPTQHPQSSDQKLPRAALQLPQLAKQQAFQIDALCPGNAGWNEVVLRIKVYQTPAFTPWRLIWQGLQKEGLRGLNIDTLRLNWKHWLGGGVTFTQLKFHF